MKIGTRVRVLTCVTGHEFEYGDIVQRYEAEYDYEMKDSLGFISQDGRIWYMNPDEYEEVE